MQAVSILGQSKSYFNLAMAKQDARRIVLDNLLAWVDYEYSASISPGKSASTHLTKRTLESMAAIIGKLGAEKWSIEQNAVGMGVRYRCCLVLTLEAWDMEYLLKMYSQLLGVHAHTGSYRQVALTQSALALES